jgi:cation transport ATPase
MTAMNRARLTLPIDGLRPVGDGAHVVERALQSVPGVVRVFVNTATEMVYVQYDPTLAGAEQFQAAIERAGFGLSAEKTPVDGTIEENGNAEPQHASRRRWLATLARALGLS